MPVDAPNTAHRDQQRRQPRRAHDESAHGEGGHAREIELKRSRGEISCAECRRLKIKCDKKLPCSSCQRRGCATLCPNGSLATGQGTRFVLAATDHLHKRIGLMSNRIRQLEDALAVLQSGCSREQHPLLRDELLSLKFDKEDTPVEADSQEHPEVIKALGTLTISDRGTSRFFGVSGGTELLLMNENDPPSSVYSSPETTNAGATPPSVSSSPPSAPEFTLFCNAFPFTPMGPHDKVQELIESYLPPRERAYSLAEAYVEGAAWLFRPVSKEQLMDEMLPAIYARVEARALDPSEASHVQGHYQVPYSGPHDLALLLMVFAVGCQVDLTQEAFNADAVHYYSLARAAICLQNVFDEPELATIQALHLMSIFNAMNQPDTNQDGGEADTSMEMSWSLIRLSHQLAQTIGLHRDAARWGLPHQEVQRRRAVFWDLFIADSWQALSTGRPPSITPPYIDTQHPVDEEATITKDGQTEQGFGSWSFDFATNYVCEVAIICSLAQVPPYSAILELDRKLRDVHVPEVPLPLGPDGKADLKKSSSIMVHYVLMHSREVILLCLHRSFFAQAMIDDPVNPIRSQYAPSFLATYRSAAHILKSIKEQFEILPQLCARMWATWTYAFSAAVVFGAVVTRGPTSTMARASLDELNSACELFNEAAKYSRRAAKASIILQKLQVKAHHALATAASSGDIPPNPSTPSSMRLSPEGSNAQDDIQEDEIEIYSGRTRVMSSKRVSPTPVTARPGTTGFSNVATSSPSAPATQSSLPLQHASVGQQDQFAQDVKPPIPMAISLSSSTSTSSTAGTGSMGSGVRELSSPPSSLADYGERGMPMWSPAQDYRDDRGPGAPYDPPNRYLIGQPQSTYENQEWVPQQQQVAGGVQPYQQYASGGQQQQVPIRSGGYAYQQQHPQLQRQPSHMQGYPPSVSVSVEFTNVPPHQMGPQQPGYGQGPGSTASSAAQPPYPYPPQSQAYGTVQAQYSYSPAPRDLTAMGLAAQNSGMNQRWTSFMQESGVFYGHSGNGSGASGGM